MVRNPASEAIDVVDMYRPPGGVASGARLLVTRPIPVEAPRAIASVVNGRADGAIHSSVPSILPAAIAAIRLGGIHIAASLLDLGRRLPALTSRQHRLMQDVSLGHSRDNQLTGGLELPSTPPGLYRPVPRSAPELVERRRSFPDRPRRSLAVPPRL